MQPASVDHAPLDQPPVPQTLGSTPFFPRLSKEAARMARWASDTRLLRFLAEYAGIQVMDACTHAETKLHSSQAIFSPSAPQAHVRMVHREGEAQVCFDIQQWPALRMLAEQPVIKPALPPYSALRHAIVDILLAPITQQLESLGLDDVHFVDLKVLEAAPITEERGLAMRVKSPSGTPCVLEEEVVLHCKLDEVSTGATVHFSLTLQSMDASLLDYVEQLLDLQPLMLSPSVLNLPIPGRALLGIQHMTLSTLCSLRCGDVLIGGIRADYRSILSPTPSLSSIELVWGSPGAQVLRGFAALEGQNVVIQKGLVVHQSDEEEQAIADSDQSMQTDEELPDLAGLDMPVHFEIDTIVMPLAQLCALGPGHVMELPIALAHAPVRLITHGKTIGSGELVAIGEHLGIRIQKMAKLDDPTH